VAFNLRASRPEPQAETIAGIFTQQITTWNAPEIARTTPGPSCRTWTSPGQPVDKSGTTENFTQYLAAVAPDVWTRSRAGTGRSPAARPARAPPASSRPPRHLGGITYADSSQVGGLGTVAVGVGEEFVEYSPEAAAAVVETHRGCRAAPGAAWP
jgi:phosphate transport system substrate-binding protein